MIHSLFEAFPIGMRCTVGSECLGNSQNCSAVVYEHYFFAGHRGISLLFPNGAFDGFSANEIDAWGVVPKSRCPNVSHYKFESVVKLRQDFKAGRFNLALGLSPQSIRRRLADVVYRFVD